MAQDNPYTSFLAEMEDDFYAPLSRGYRARLWALYALVGYTLLVALLYLTITVVDLRRKEKLWMFRVVERPQGRYAIVNQYLYYPLGCAVTSIIWLAGYIPFVQSIFIEHARGTWGFYWVYLHTVPAYMNVYLTTVVVMASANLMSTRNGHHLLPPWASNGLLISFPFLAIIVVAPSVQAGAAWKVVSDAWEGFRAEVASRAGGFVGGEGGDAQGTLKELAGRLQALLTPLTEVFDTRSRLVMSLALTGAVFVLLLNIIGAITIVFRLRQSSINTSQIVPRGAPIVAPLQPFAATPSEDGKTLQDPFGAGAAGLHRSRTQEWREGMDLGGGEVEPSEENGGSRLPWDVTLFYLTTIPFATVYIMYASWILSPDTPFAHQKAATELAVTGIVWAKSFLDAVGLTALLMKRCLDSRRRRSARSNNASSPLPVALPLERRRMRRRSSGEDEDEFDFPHRCRVAEEEDDGGAELRRGPSLMQVVVEGKT